MAGLEPVHPPAKRGAKKVNIENVSLGQAKYKMRLEKRSRDRSSGVRELKKKETLDIYASSAVAAYSIVGSRAH